MSSRLLTLLAVGCGSKNATGTISVPDVTALVTEALPVGLRPGGTTPTMHRRLPPADVATPTGANAALASSYLISLFQDTFFAVDANVQGYLLSQVATVDKRLALFANAPVTGCLADAPVPVDIDLGAIDPMLSFSLDNIQCYTPPPIPSAQAGEAFGVDGTNTSVWDEMNADFTTTGGFLTYANVSNAGSMSSAAPEIVSGVSIVFTPNVSGNMGGALDITRFIATPTTNTFEMFYGSSRGRIGTSMLGAGFRMRSDGNYVYADGTLCTDPTGVDCKDNAANWQAFSACLDATTILPHEPVSDCTTLAGSFTLNNDSASLTFTEITGDPNVSHAYGYFPPTNVGPTPGNVALVEPIGQISMFASLVAPYGP